jgi:hypothetical protein
MRVTHGNIKTGLKRSGCHHEIRWNVEFLLLHRFSSTSLCTARQRFAVSGRGEDPHFYIFCSFTERTPPSRGGVCLSMVHSCVSPGTAVRMLSDARAMTRSAAGPWCCVRRRAMRRDGCRIPMACPPSRKCARYRMRNWSRTWTSRHVIDLTAPRVWSGLPCPPAAWPRPSATARPPFWRETPPLTPWPGPVCRRLGRRRA